jgi:C-terminal processing protease CtpA/Prc
MKKNSILLILFFSIVSPSLLADTLGCGTVSTRSTFLKNNEYRIKLYYLGETKSTTLLKPGLHQLIAKVIYNKKGNVGDESTYIFGNDALSQPISFEIDVKKNTMYQIVATTEDRHNRKADTVFEISIKKESNKYCEFEKTPKVIENIDKNSNTIPENLQYRLDLVVMDLKDYLQRKNPTEKNINIDKKQRIINTIGIVTSKNKSKQMGINILAITPFSIAAKLGLKPEDTILSINGMDLTLDNKLQSSNASVVTVFKNILVNLSENENVEIEIMRKNKKTILRSSYKELSLPSYHLKIMMN